MGSGLHPKYTRADFGQEAVGGPNNSTSPTQHRQVWNVAQTNTQRKESSLNTSVRSEPNATLNFKNLTLEAFDVKRKM